MGTGSDADHDEPRFARFETKDGLAVRIRAATPNDEDLLIAGFEQLSDESRYQRFFSPTPHLSASTVDRLLDAGAGHVILAAFVRDDGGDNNPDDDGNEGWTPAGGIRAVWLTEEPGTAEMAVTVIDAYQGRGLGTLLTSVVAAVVAERGITTLSAEVLALNEPMLGVFRSYGAELQRHPNDATVIVARLDTAVAAARLPSRKRAELVAAVSPADRASLPGQQPG